MTLDPTTVDKPAPERVKLGNRRVTGKEQYYTPSATATQVVERLVATKPEVIRTDWIEPAGGTGTFVDAARAFAVDRIVSYDIEPHHEAVMRGDFLEQCLSLKGATAVGNPPFGRNNSLSIPFFNRCAHYSDVICFIVPKSWRKWSVSNRLDLSFHLVDDYELAINYVDVNGELISDGSNLRTVVQTWERRDERRGRVMVQDRGIVRKCKPEVADVSLTIFGFSCGTVKTDFPRKPNTTQMFLQLVHPQALEALEAVDFSRFFNNTAYTEALSLKEINFLLNEYIYGDPGVYDPDVDQPQASLF